MNTIDRRKQALLKGDLNAEFTWPPKSPKAKRKYFFGPKLLRDNIL